MRHMPLENMKRVSASCCVTACAWDREIAVLPALTFIRQKPTA